MQKFDHRSLIYGTIVIQERILVRQGKQTVTVRAIEVPLYMRTARETPPWNGQQFMNATDY